MMQLALAIILGWLLPTCVGIIAWDLMKHIWRMLHEGKD